MVKSHRYTVVSSAKVADEEPWCFWSESEAVAHATIATHLQAGIPLTSEPHPDILPLIRRGKVFAPGVVERWEREPPPEDEEMHRHWEMRFRDARRSIPAVVVIDLEDDWHRNHARRVA